MASRAGESSDAKRQEEKVAGVEQVEEVRDQVRAPVVADAVP